MRKPWHSSFNLLKNGPWWTLLQHHNQPLGWEERTGLFLQKILHKSVAPPKSGYLRTTVFAPVPPKAVLSKCAGSQMK